MGLFVRFFLFSTSPRKYPQAKPSEQQEQPQQDPQLLPVSANVTTTTAALEAPFSRTAFTSFPVNGVNGNGNGNVNGNGSSDNSSLSSTASTTPLSATARTSLLSNGVSLNSSTDDLGNGGGVLRQRAGNRPAFSRASRSARTTPASATTTQASQEQTRGLADLLLARLDYNSNSTESLDWFNVLLAQIINQYRSDARANGRLATVLNDVLNGPKKPDFLDEIKLTELSTGEDFPIFSNCRVHKRPKPAKSQRSATQPSSSSSLQSPTRSNQAVPQSQTADPDLVAEMDVDLSDTITMGIETRVLLRQPRWFSTVMPVSLVVSIVRFSARMIVRISRITIDPLPEAPNGDNGTTNTDDPSSQQQPQKNTMLVLRISFHPDFTLEVAVKSLLGSRSMLHDMPRIGHIIEGQLRKWFTDNFVEPGYKQVVLFRYQSDNMNEP